MNKSKLKFESSSILKNATILDNSNTENNYQSKPHILAT